MAKLDGVKVIDMTAGEVTKVAYEGEEYERAEHPIKKDDLILNVDDHEIDLTLGAFYKVISVDNFNDVQFLDDEDDGRDRHEDDIDFVPFRKVAAQDPTIEARVGKLESDVAALKGEQETTMFKAGDKALLKVGDYAKVVGETYHGDFRKGTVVKIAKDVDEDGDYKIELLDESDYDYAQASSLEKVDADKAEELAKWAKIGREVDEYKEGDVVRVLDVKKSFAFDLSGGEINVITKFCDNDSFQVGSGSGWVGATQVELVAPVESRVDR
ncbi:hypothetical protein [Shouchella clausii]|uniref:hypothetical protein n=1 Tax=Shouchella clausii TaxID=79880 RepID=UPI00226C8D91|nr:hypothetical protein [Shouchella clausii]MCY1105823.1 hypothetical protein [Shouchella clausii]